jgi:hypothetical protein
MTNEDIAFGYRSNVLGIAALLRSTADRIERDGLNVYVRPDGQPEHSTAAANVVQEVMNLLGGLPTFNLIQNAAHADAQWNPKQPEPNRVSVALTGVGDGRFGRTVAIVRDHLPGKLSEADRVVRATEIVNLVRTYPDRSAKVTEGLTRPQAQELVDKLARAGSSGRIV